MPVFSISIRELRPKLPEVVSDVLENMNRYIITKRGRPTGIILSMSDYDSLVESLQVQFDRELIKDIYSSKRNSQKGRLLEDVRKEL